MIGQDHNVAERVVEDFKALVGYGQLDPDAAAEFDELSATAGHLDFPGALLVWHRAGKPAVYYALAADSAQWRRLRPLLMAYAGPTLTSFNGWPAPLLPERVPIEKFLSEQGWHTVARLVPGEDLAVQEMTRRSLQRMLATLQSMPTITLSAPEPTSRLLARFVDCLNGDDYAGAEQILALCKNELRLDALNLLFLRVRLLAHFGKWHDILGMPEFDALRHTRKPALVTATLLEAQARDLALPGDQPIQAWLEQWTPERRALVRPLLQLPIPAGCTPAALRLYALEALCAEPRDAALEQAVLAYAGKLGPFADVLLEHGRNGAAAQPADGGIAATAPLQAAQQAIVSAKRSDTMAAIAEALDSIDRLDEAQRGSLLGSETFKRLFNELVAEAGPGIPPRNWHEWLARLADPGFDSAYEVLERAVVEWPAATLADPAAIVAFAQALAAVPELPPAVDRIADALPALVAWVADDPGYPRPGMTAVYETLLYHLIIGVRRGAAVLESAALLIRGLLQVGLGAKAYESLLVDCLQLAGDGMSRRGVYWLFGIIEETIQSDCPSASARQNFWLACHERFAQIQAYLTPGQRIAFAALAISLGWPALPEPAATQDDPAMALRDALAGKSIAIYTLTEAASRQASQVLRGIVPSVRISMSSDLVGTPELKTMAQGADIFVLVTASAKHAASGFIQQHRPKDKALLFANGRGFTSILRVIEEHVLND